VPSGLTRREFTKFEGEDTYPWRRRSNHNQVSMSSTKSKITGNWNTGSVG